MKYEQWAFCSYEISIFETKVMILRCCPKSTTLDRSNRKVKEQNKLMWVASKHKKMYFFWNSNSLTNKVESGSVQKPPQKLVFLCLFPHFIFEESCILGNRNSIPHCFFKDLDFNMIANVNIQNRNNYRLDLIIHCHCMPQIDDYFNG